MKDHVISKLNNKKYKRITHTHLKKFNMTKDEYLEKYNLTENDLIAPTLRDKFSWTLEKSIAKYGKVLGPVRWKEYCDKQAHSNSYEYKNEKYGMSESEFRDYNLSRAVTEENMIKRHGEVEGLRKWKEYCDKQAYAGCSVDYFKEIYGDDKGLEIYKQLNDKKGLTVANFIRKYGKDDGMARYVAYNEGRRMFYSNKSQLLFEALNHGGDHVYYATKNGEFSSYDEDLKRIFFYDYVDTAAKKCIEFHGDVFHGNPLKYKKSDCPNPWCKELTAGEIWKNDEIKNTSLKRVKGFDTMVIWESEYDSNPQMIVDKCNKFLGYE